MSALALMIASAWSLPALAGPPDKVNPEAPEEAQEGTGERAPDKEATHKHKARKTRHAKHDAKAAKAKDKKAEASGNKADPYGADAEPGDDESEDGADAADKPEGRNKKEEAAKPARDERPSSRGNRASHASGAKATASSKAEAKQEAKAEGGKHAASSSAKGKKTKKTASRGKKKAPKSGADTKAPPRPCLGPTVLLDRNGTEAESMMLVDCNRIPRPEALVRLSVLARPWGAGSREPAGAAAKLDPGLLTRLDAIARKFPNKTLSIVSGYRPTSRGSLHQSGRAVDMRVEGVDNLEVVGFCRSLADTGCGFYPNSSFVHVDVRPPGTGVVHWIDASGPGEPPRYVSAWPPPPGEMPAPQEPAPSRNERPAQPKQRPSQPPAETDDAEETEDDGDTDEHGTAESGSRAGEPLLPEGARGNSQKLGPSLLPAWDTPPLH